MLFILHDYYSIIQREDKDKIKNFYKFLKLNLKKKKLKIKLKIKFILLWYFYLFAFFKSNLIEIDIQNTDYFRIYLSFDF